MATNSLHSLHRHHRRHHHHHHHLLFHTPPSTLSFLFLKPTTTTTLSSTAIFSITPTTSSTPTSSNSQKTTFELLQQYLATKNYRQADEETRRLLIALAGEAAVKRGYVFFSEVQFIPELELKAIDELWRQHSDNKFGYSVQKKIYEKTGEDFSKFFVKVGWMKKLDTEVVQYNYKSFPTEFIWELGDDTPVGHLPLTNALRGTQLLKCIFGHPAFQTIEEKVEEDEVEDGSVNGVKGLKENSQELNKRVFKTDYSF